MANRHATFLLKRSNVPGKVPPASGVTLGEILLNTADAVLYTSGTTANQILPIGWDRVYRTGDTLNGDFTVYGDIEISGSSLPSGYALSVTGDTNIQGDVYVSGDLNYNGNLLVTGGTIIQSGLTANTIYTDYIDFNTNYTGGTLPEGRLQWDDGNGTLVLGLKGGQSNMELGLENMALCYNAELTTLTAGTIVYVSGSQGNRPAIKRAIATGDGYSVTTLGMVSETITSGSEGFVTTFGMVNNLNTIGLTGGTALWLSPTVAGGYTSVKPQAPYHTVLIGYAVRIHASVGSIFMHISNGWELDELHDVRLNGRTHGDLLMLSGYNGTNVWVNTKTLNGSYTITGNTTIGGNLIVTGGTQSRFSGNSSTDLVIITQTGTGNALVVEDSDNPDSSPFVVNAIGRVGVGTNNPLAKFVVSNNNVEGIEMGYDTGLSSNYLESFNRSSGLGVDMSYYISNTGSHRFYTNGTERVRIDNSGNVGIGTTNPNNLLDIQKSTGTGDQIVGRFLAGTNTNGSAGGITLGSTQTQAGYIYGVQTAASSGDLVFGNQYLGSYAERMRILASGNVGIGTTSPTEKLHVSGNTIVSGTISGSTITITSTPTNNDSPTQILTRNSTTGQVEGTSPQSSGFFNYGIANAIITGNFLI